MRPRTTRIIDIVCAAGLAWAAPFALAQESKPADKQPIRGTEAESRRALCYFSTLKGLNIRNAQNETVAEVRDVVFDRHSGDISAYVVSSSWLGWGDDPRVLFPSEVRHYTGDDGKVALRVDTNKDALTTRIEFNSAVFEADQTGKPENIAWWNRYVAESDKHVRGDTTAYQAEKITNTSPVEVQGTVIAVSRERGEGRVYRSIVQIRESDGMTRTVVVGPTWYLADHRSLPVRGQKVDMRVVPIQPIDGASWAASSIEVDGGQRLVLRKGDSLAPTWYSGDTNGNLASAQRRLLLATSLIGDEVKCREELSGEVDNLVIDFGSGRVVAFVIDPNEAFLGIGDTTRLIPVSVASPSADDLVYLDATKEMIVQAPAAPSSLEELNNRWELEKVFDQRPMASRR